jgi:hypothetical protein
MTTPGAAVVFVHWAPPGSRVTSAPANWVTMIAVIASLAIMVAVAITVASRRATRRRGDDDTDFGGGGGGRGPDAPRDPEGDPAWWPEFERQFADYANAPTPVMSRPTMSVCIVSVPSKVCSASMSAMCRMT